MENGKLVVYEEGQIVFREGDPAEGMFILIDGAIELTKRGEHGETMLKTVDQANEFFGEMALIDGKPRSATARATKMSSLIAVDGATFEHLLMTNGKFAVKIIKVLSERIRRANIQIQDLADTDPRDRILRGVADYAFRFGEAASGEARYVSVEEMRTWINGHTGCAREAIDAVFYRLLKSKELSAAATRAGDEDRAVVSGDFLRTWDRRKGGKRASEAYGC